MSILGKSNGINSRHNTIFFFFSSRRRHTRSLRDWSSDVCSSDLAERLRAGGSGIGAFFTMTGVGTQIAEGGLPWRYDDAGNVAVASPPKQTQDFEWMGETRTFVLEQAITTDFGLVRATKGDRHGNLVFNQSARNFNPLCAMAGRITVAEVEELVEPGELDPDQIHLPGIFVQRVLPLTPEQAATKRIERRTVRPRPDAQSTAETQEA